ncbi:nucleoside recognition domain-containing protein [Cohnella massiliensis]|uniref:nucleoside recognition domain-containing protein n=1 Tax=Cohnella massiliensis TaxID=1816691 RepID=UPI0009BB21F4|nr:nucleoside recognition domain-containing protein [Cohnella massiliensis]
MSKRMTASDPVRLVKKTMLLGTGLLALWIGGMALTMPGEALQASLRGLAVWWEVLFPALFPFFVLSELLLGFGVVHLTGTLLDPLMRPLFRIPGVGGFVVAMGFASGYPVGARLTSRLMEQRLVNREEGERLVAMTTSSDPIFLIGAVCIGFFGRADIAPVMAAAHYGGAMLLGLALRGRGRTAEAGKPEASGASSPVLPEDGGRMRRALAAMHHARLADGRPFGVMLQDALESSIRLMIVVGGLVVFFSVALELLLHSGILSALRSGLGAVLGAIGLVPGLAEAVVQGSFEVTLGSRAAAEAAKTAPLIDQVAAGAFVLSWAGLSVHAQVAGLMSRTSWRYLPFLRARLLHAAFAVGLIYLLWPLLGPHGG